MWPCLRRQMSGTTISTTPMRRFRGLFAAGEVKDRRTGGSVKAAVSGHNRPVVWAGWNTKTSGTHT